MGKYYNRYELGIELVTRFGKLLGMNDGFYRIRPIETSEDETLSREVTPGKFWSKIMKGQAPKVGDKVQVEAHSFGSGTYNVTCCVKEVRTSRFGLDEAYVTWLGARAPTTLEELGEAVS